MDTLCDAFIYKWQISRVHQRILSRKKMRNKTVFGLLLLLVAYLSGLLDGSSTGDQACYSIMPDHNATAQMSPAPFYILIDDDCSINDDDNGKKASHSNQTSAVNG